MVFTDLKKEQKDILFPYAQGMLLCQIVCQDIKQDSCQAYGMKIIMANSLLIIGN